MRLRTVACVAAAIVAAVAVPVSARIRPVDFPSTPVAISVPIPPSVAADAAPAAENAAPRAAALPVPAPAQTVDPVGDVPSRPQDLVRVVYAIKASDGAPAAAAESKGVCPAAPTCDVFGITGYRFRPNAAGKIVINYKYNDTDRRDLRSPDPATVRAAIHAAAATWSHWDSRIVFNDTGDTTATFGAPGPDGTCADGINSISWGRFEDPDDVGEAGMCLDKSQHVIRDADIQLNIGYWWSNGLDPRRQVYDVQEILTHEMGHWLSLVDQYSGLAGAQTMFGSADVNETRKRTPALGDVIGVQTAYPCRPGESCPRSGIVKD